MVSSSCGFHFGFVVEILIFDSHLPHRLAIWAGGSFPPTCGADLKAELGKSDLRFHLSVHSRETQTVVGRKIYIFFCFVKGKVRLLKSASLQPHSDCLMVIHPEVYILSRNRE